MTAERVAGVGSGNILVLIDPYTRKVVESVTYDALTKHATVITDIREITEANYGCEFVFFEPAVPAFVSGDLISEFMRLYSIVPHLVYGTKEVAEAFAGCAVDCVRANYTNLEWNLIYAVINADSAILEPYQRSRAAVVEFAQLVDGLPIECRGSVGKMYQSYLALAHAYSELLERNAFLSETVENYKSVGNKTSAAITELQTLLRKATDENRTYCAMLSESYDVTFNGMYADRPRVLYIKTISHLAGIDSLLMVLYAVLTKQYKVSCKIIKLVDSSNAVSVRYIPNAYVPLSDTYNTADVLSNDFLVNLGAYNILMNLIMLNRSGLDVLVVHDMRGTMNSALDDSLVDLKLHEISGDYSVLGEYENILTDVSAGAQFIWKYEDVMEYTGTKTSKLANHPTIAHIIDYLM